MMNKVVQGTILAAVLSAVLNAVIYLVAQGAGVSFALNPGASPFFDIVPLIAVIGFSILTAVIAGVLVSFLGTREGGLNLFLWIAAIVSLLSLFPVYTGARDSATLIMLGLMHVASTLAIVYGLTLHFTENPFPAT